MKLILTIGLLVVFLNGIVADSPCDNQQSCTTCVNTPTASCGWCTATQKCFQGTINGPNSTYGQLCMGSAWQYGQCVACSSLKDCRSCKDYDSDCRWCTNSKTCQQIVLGGNCTAALFCPCGDFASCTECVNDPVCKFCGNSATCEGLATNCPGGGPSYNGTGNCDCSVFGDCGTCRENDGCAWCNSGTPRCVSAADTTCNGTSSCDAWCGNAATDCATCVQQNSCGWCPATSTCVDARTATCLLRHSCPNCDHSYCDPCIDNPDCQWCGDLRQCQVRGASNCFLTHTCESYCQGYSTCGECNNVLGCGWCDSSSVCVDMDKSSCPISHLCGSTPVPPPQQCPFDGGAFVGGMFLVIGIIVLVVLGIIFYRWKTGKKLLYTELR